MNINNFCFPVHYYNPDGSLDRVVEVKKVPRAKLRDLIVLQQQLLDVFVEHEASIGSILSEESNWRLIESTGKLLPLVGDEEYLDVSKFEDDYVQICKVFFTDSIKSDGTFDLKEGQGFEPSKISKLHQLNYGEQLGKALEKSLEKKEKKLKQSPKE